MRDTVSIKIDSRQLTDSEETHMESTYSGKYHAFPKMHTVLYEESIPGEHGQSAGTVKNILKIEKDTFTLIKKGLIKTEMRFQNGNVHRGFYQTPYGAFDMAIHTSQLKISSETERITIRLKYTVELGGQQVSECHMSIHIHNA